MYEKKESLYYWLSIDWHHKTNNFYILFTYAANVLCPLSAIPKPHQHESHFGISSAWSAHFVMSAFRFCCVCMRGFSKVSWNSKQRVHPKCISRIMILHPYRPRAYKNAEWDGPWWCVTRSWSDNMIVAKRGDILHNQRAMCGAHNTWIARCTIHIKANDFRFWMVQWNYFALIQYMQSVWCLRLWERSRKHIWTVFAMQFLNAFTTQDFTCWMY